jgi:hypothetical protein
MMILVQQKYGSKKMKKHNYSSKGLSIKKLNNNAMVSENNFEKQKEFLLKLPFFKTLNIISDVIVDKKLSNKYTKEYLIMAKNKNNIDDLINAEEKSDIMMSMVVVEMIKPIISGRL